MMSKRVLLVTRHDFRSGWRANFHFIADAFYKSGFSVQFFSVGFSSLSILKKDRRSDLNSKSNKWETVSGIDCFLWKTFFHPFRVKSTFLQVLMTPIFALWTILPCSALDSAANNADLILVESDLSSTLLPRLRRKAPHTPILYIASDLLRTIDAAPQIEANLRRQSSAISHVIAVSRGMLPELEKLGRPLSYVPHGIDPDDFCSDDASPYTKRQNAVTVGSMLFDPNVISVAAEAFPEMTFHLIGTPAVGRYPANVIEYGPLKFSETITWLKNADVGIAPYRESTASHYLADSSLKLIQYGYFALPAVCPYFAVGDYPLRFSYDPNDNASIIEAFRAAQAKDIDRRPTAVLTWLEVVQRFVGIATLSQVGIPGTTPSS